MGKPLISSTPKQGTLTSPTTESERFDTSSELLSTTKPVSNTVDVKTNIPPQKESIGSHIKMRPVHYDGTEDWEEYLSQFEILADINK